MASKTILALTLVASATTLVPQKASARPGDLSTFDSVYGISGTRLDTCSTCHTVGSGLNDYGQDLSSQPGITEHRLRNIELLDSDGDGYSNIDEINNLSFPGDPASTPETVQPAVSPFSVVILVFMILVLAGAFLLAFYLTRRMKEVNLRKWHRYIAIPLSPLIALQAISGVLLASDWLLGFHHRIGEPVKGVPPLVFIWDKLLVEIHYGLGLPGAVEHILLGIGLAWVTISGLVIFLRVRARKRKRAAKSA